MFYELPLLSGGAGAGRAEYEENGLRLRFRCRMPGRNELCKLYLAAGEQRLLLGTPAPVNGGLYLERTLSRSELERSGVYPPERVEVDKGERQPRQTQPVWQDVTAQAPKFCDPLLERMFRQGGWGWRRWEGGVVLCRMWRERESFPAMPVFCFVRLRRSGGGTYVFCYLDGEGRPCFPPE